VAHRPWAAGRHSPSRRFAADILRIQINARLPLVGAALRNGEAGTWCCIAGLALYPRPCPYRHLLPWDDENDGP
jgi:hypothetical protein